MKQLNNFFNASSLNMGMTHESQAESLDLKSSLPFPPAKSRGILNGSNSPWPEKGAGPYLALAKKKSWGFHWAFPEKEN